MRITSIRLKNYKRFTDLCISDIPRSARLVVLVGPNGSGKSSLFDAFLLKSQSQRTNSSLSKGIYQWYLVKNQTTDIHHNYTSEVANDIEIELDKGVEDWSRAFSIRSPYRHEADFANTNLGPVPPANESPRFQRIIDQDQAVSDNFSRLGRRALYGALKGDSGEKSLNQFREDTFGALKRALEKLFGQPPLILQDLGASLDSGAFRFQKGSVADFHYKNLSGGEKAAFDLLLDIYVKRSEYHDAIYCIDEPESHTASAIHGKLLDALLELIPDKSQLWIATHSIGFVRRAVELNRSKDRIAFLDFSDHDFDQRVHLQPTIPRRTFFRKIYDVLQEDLAGLVAPANIVLCEGSDDTDSKVYNRVFEESHPDTLFVSRGGSSDVEKQDIVSLFDVIVPRARVWRLIDRDEMHETTRDEKIAEGIHVLRRREIENYLWDKAVIRKALENNGLEATAIDEVLDAYPFSNLNDVDMKKCNRLQALFNNIRRAGSEKKLGRTRREFASDHLALALRDTDVVYRELMEDVFPPDLR